MDIRRKVYQGGLDVAITRVSFCLDMIEELEFDLEKFCAKEWGKNLTHEEIIGALVSAEQELESLLILE